MGGDMVGGDQAKGDQLVLGERPYFEAQKYIMGLDLPLVHRQELAREILKEVLAVSVPPSPVGHMARLLAPYGLEQVLFRLHHGLAKLRPISTP